MVEQIVVYTYAAVVALVAFGLVVWLAYDSYRDNERIEVEFGPLLAWVRAASSTVMSAVPGADRYTTHGRHRATRRGPKASDTEPDRLVASAPVVLSDHKPSGDAAFAQVGYSAAGRASLPLPFDQQVRDRNDALHALHEGLRFEKTTVLPAMREAAS